MGKTKQRIDVFDETSDVFVARQPVMDRRGALVAYELHLRHAACATAVRDEDFLCSSGVIARALGSFGFDVLLGGSDGHLACSEELLCSATIEVLPAGQFVLEIVEYTTLSAALRERCEKLRQMGFRIALGGVRRLSGDIQTFLPCLDIVKIDWPHVAPYDLPDLVGYFKKKGKQVLAGNVENRLDHEAALELGCDLIQGYYFSKPQLVRAKKALPSGGLVLRVLQLLLDDAEHATVAAALRETPLLITQLLRLANSGEKSQGGANRVSSIKQALAIAGSRRLIQWCCLLLYANPDGLPATEDPLVGLAQRRASLMAKISRKVRVADDRYEQTAYLTGMLSLLHVMYGTDARTFVEELPLAPSIKAAIAYREGELGRLLDIAEHLERGEVRIALGRISAAIDGADFGTGFLRSLLPS
ncbi:EAL domain-containing protein [Robbsia sp. Bb-Pol-6]|uniref:EAL domain-containing protein n=1 Tax=Robbsia betulipollinis TaxID=2981849 RepID=A0ABT3ZIL7_9BURK|nr:EAL domain-containing protein [Robbsia betulipollinis]MCY0385790.1 EAL domain-containing protein [Robbsia betulipollinis]